MKAIAIIAVTAGLIAGGCGLTDWVGDSHTPTRRVSVYEYGQVSGRYVLHAVRLRVPAVGDAVFDAVTALLTREPERRDRDSLWHGTCAPADAVVAVRRTPNLTTVHLKRVRPNEEPVACEFAPKLWAIGIQQLAWTVRTSTASTAPVKVTVNGHTLTSPIRSRRGALAGSTRFLAHGGALEPGTRY